MADDAAAGIGGIDIAGIERGPPVILEVNGIPVRAWEGESLSAALLRAGRMTTRLTPKLEQPRGYYCGMGVCYECMAEIVGVGTRRSCQVEVVAGMRVLLPDLGR